MVSDLPTEETIEGEVAAGRTLVTDTGAFISPLLLAAVGVVVLVCVGVFFIKKSVSTSTTAASDSANTAASALADRVMSGIYPNADQGATTLAAPPSDLGVAQPSLEAIMSLANAELTRDLNNGEVAQTNNGFTSTPVSKQQDEVYQKTIGDCWKGRAGTSGCESARQGVQADINAREHNRMMESAQRTQCEGRVGGAVSLRNAGHYHKFDHLIYFAVKVYAPGEEGAFRDGQCVYKPAIAGLTSTIVVRFDEKKPWLSWQLASKGELESVSYDFNKKASERRKEEWDNERYRRSISRQQTATPDGRQK